MASNGVYKKHFGENRIGSHSERFSTVYEHLSDQKGSPGGIGLLVNEIDFLPHSEQSAWKIGKS